MFGFLFRRIVAGISVVFMVMVAAFTLFFIGPQDPARQMCGERTCNSERLAEVRKSLSLDQPAYVQFSDYVGGIFAGRTVTSGGSPVECPAPCLGYSFKYNQPVTGLIFEALPVTISVALGAMVVFLGIGVPLGAFAAIRRGTKLDKGLVASSLVINSFPYYLVALLTMLYLTVKIGILPRGGWTPFWENPAAFFTGLLAPWLVLGIFFSTQYARYTRASMVDALGEDYIRTARAKGVKPRDVNFRHALRASLTSVFTILGIDMAGLLGGTIFTERIFDVKGIGLLTLEAFSNGDISIIMGSVIYTSALLVTLNILVDIAYGFLDPRVRQA